MTRTTMRGPLGPVFLACTLGFQVACVGDIGTGPAGPSSAPGPTPMGRDEAGIRLTPPEGTGARALRCEPDHAPLRRLAYREYHRTIRDLFPGMTLPSVDIGLETRRTGFFNNYQALGVTEELVAQYLSAAATLAEAATPTLMADLSCSDAACFDGFVASFGARAYRRPLTDAERTRYGDIFRSGATAGDFEESVQLAVTTFLQAPQFLYRPELGGGDAHLTQHEIASRLSYFVWGSMPDDALFAAADSGELTGAALETHVDRMLTDPRAREGLVAATGEWLDIDRLADRVKADEFAFTPQVRARLRESFEMFIWERVFRGERGIEDFYVSDGAYVDSTIGRYFGIDDAGPELEWRTLPHRHGMLTHPAVLAVQAHDEIGSPILRGAFVLREILCDPPMPAPPGAVMMTPPRTAPDGTLLTTRQGTEILTEQPGSTCSGCHLRMNPFGFAFESYDTVGAFRTEEFGQPVDSSGESPGFTLGRNYSFDGAEELTAQIAESHRARACIVDRWVRYAAGGGPLAFDPCIRSDLQEIVERPDANLRDLVLAIALDPRFAAAQLVEEVSE